MTDREKIKELLESAKELINSFSEGYALKKIDQALSLLFSPEEKDKCPMCKGTGKAIGCHDVSAFYKDDPDTKYTDLPNKPPEVKSCGTQKEMQKEAMQAIEERREGRNKLVYDKRTKTIIAVPNPAFTSTGKAPAGEVEKFIIEARGHIKHCLDINFLKMLLNKALDFLDRLAAEKADLQGRLEKCRKLIRKYHPQSGHDHDYWHDDCGLCLTEKNKFEKIKQYLDPRDFAEIQKGQE